MKCYYCDSELVYSSLFPARKCPNDVCFANTNSSTILFIFDNGNYYIPFKNKSGVIGQISSSIASNLISAFIATKHNKYVWIYNLPYRDIKTKEDIGDIMHTICKLFKKSNFGNLPPR